MSEDIRRNAEGYIALTDDTLDSLAFLLDNVGQSAALDLRVESVSTLESMLRDFHRMRNPDELFPELVETFAQLLAQYGALVLLEQTAAPWNVDANKASHFFGQPFIDVVPGEPWQGYYPIHWQQVLRSDAILRNQQFVPLSRQLESAIKERAWFDALVEEIEGLIKVSQTGSLSEADIVTGLVQAGCAPNSSGFAAAARTFPKRVARILRKSGLFSRNRNTHNWHVKRTAT